MLKTEWVNASFFDELQVLKIKKFCMIVEKSINIEVDKACAAII